MNKSKITMSKVGRLLILIALFSLLFIPMTALADLPPRPIPATTSTSGDDKDDDKDDTPPGAQITLSGGVSGGWAVVQWLGSDGNWHDVEGWRASYGGSLTWYVAGKDFGTGPFRWAVYDQPGGTIISQSESFNLPSEANQVLQVFAASVQ